MRTREEITHDTEPVPFTSKDEFGDPITDFWSPKLTKEEAILEILLDIRDLLNK